MSTIIIMLGIALSLTGFFIVFLIRQTNSELREKLSTAFEGKSDYDFFSEVLKRHLEVNLKQTNYNLYTILDNNLEQQLTTVFHDNYFSILSHLKQFNSPLELHKTLYKTQLSDKVIRNLFHDKKDTQNIVAFYAGVFAVITIYIIMMEEDEKEITKHKSPKDDLDLFFANYHIHFKSNKGHIDNIYIDEKNSSRKAKQPLIRGLR